MSTETTAKGRLARMKEQAYEIKALSQGVFSLVIKGREDADEGLMASTLLIMLERHADEIAEAADRLELEVSHG